jgi:glycosyltransferase involved in cell wall biosynthesis
LFGGLAVKISAVIPLYNGANYVAESIEAVLAQSKQAAEIIVVDDCSTDNSRQIVERYRDKVTLLSIDQNSGVQTARNLGITHARTDWVALCDQDDIWSAGYLARLSDLLESEPGIEFSFSNFRTLRHRKLIAGTKFDQAPEGYWEAAGRRVVSQGWVFDRSFAGLTFLWHPIFPSATAFTKRLIEKVGAFNPVMKGIRPEDGEFTLRCLYRAKVGVLPEPLVTIRRHEANFSSDGLLSLIDEVKALEWIKQNHEEARQYRAIIDSEIRRRRIAAVHGAFAARRHELMRALLTEVSPEDRSINMRIKALIASLPDSVGLVLNNILQGASEHARSLRRAVRPARRFPPRDPARATAPASPACLISPQQAPIGGSQGVQVSGRAAVRLRGASGQPSQHRRPSEADVHHVDRMW